MINYSDTSEQTNKNAQNTPEPELNKNIRIDQSVEEQNDEAVRSIMAVNSKTTATTNSFTTTQQQSEIIMYDGSIDNYLKSTCQKTSLAIKPKETSYATAPNYVMVPNQFPYDPTKQIYLVNNSLLNVNLPAPTGITEQDILSMPTVIVNEGNKSLTAQQPVQIKIQSMYFSLIDYACES